MRTSKTQYLVGITPEDRIRVTMNKRKNGCEVMRRKNVKFAFDYLLEAVKNLEILKIIPPGAHVIFIPHKDRWLQNRNLQMAKHIINQGDKVILLPVK